MFQFRKTCRTTPHNMIRSAAAASIRVLRRPAQAGVAISVVHAVHETMWPVLARLRDDGVARVVSVHGLRFATPAWAGRLNTRMLAAAADRIICVSDVVRQVFRNWNVPERKLALVPSSVDSRAVSPRCVGPRVPPRVGNRSRCATGRHRRFGGRAKGLTYFLDACAWLRTRYPDARFVVVGPVEDGAAGASGPVAYVQHLRARATALDLSNCLSFVPARPDIPM